MKPLLETPNLSIIPIHEFRAIQLRFQGVEYQHISIKLKEEFDVDVPKTTISWWFYKNGKLAGIYREYADQMINLEMETARDLLKSYLKPAVKTLGQGLAGIATAVQVASAKEIIERGLGKVREEIDLKHAGTIGVAMLDVLAALKEVKNKNYADDEGTNQDDNQGAG
ncbi:MAG: hypothetical protein A3F67_04210 [Verrucomicrobia bacterium RIFCSPHIGHO2_12_FULL_41_10]|nr:MAG: hypothetical protein A3F67_04210 [Verrucomicrobia bacterium RIFCSPHIGHO2_12_FULL_41_10]HLB57754.1 hypothetical protein [Gammaproteobacteria bacterium]